MDRWNPSTEHHSFIRRLTRVWHQIYYVHRLQWYRWVMRPIAAFHLNPTVGKLHWHYVTHHFPSIFPDLLALVLSVAGLFIWHFLFRDPWAFLGYKRPGRTYRWVVGGIVAVTIVPNGAVHIWALKAALRNDSPALAGTQTAVSAIVLFISLAGLVGWMTWKFLLGWDESNEDFEPVLKNRVAVHPGQRQDWATSVVEPYRDDPPIRGVVENGYLSEAYRMQSLATQELPSNRDIAGITEPIEARPLNGVSHEEGEGQGVHPDDALNATSAIATTATEPPRCRTIARFEYMSQQHSGPHSWFTDPILPLLLSPYATILLVVIPIFIHEDRTYGLRAPSPTLKKSLYWPLGMYLLSFYVLKHRIRESLFTRFSILPPQPWKELISFLPSWVGTGGTFRNQDTGEITVYDPRRRAFPWQAYHNSALIRTRSYIQKYNEKLHTCESYWGHSGRPAKSDFRFRPTIYRIGFLTLAVYLTIKGFWNTVFYDLPDPTEEGYTPEDLARIRRILAFWHGLAYPGLYPTAIALALAGTSIGSMVTLFSKAVWNHAPVEEKERIYRMGQEIDELERERRIRLQ